MFCSLFVTLLAWLHNVNGRGLSPHQREIFYSHPIHSQYYESYLKPLHTDYDDKYGGAGTEYHFTQVLDHFNAYNGNITFEQRYYINDTFFDASKQGPYLFMPGGEWVNNGFNSNYGLIAVIAEKLNGLMITAEHRFYGKSCPFGNITSYQLSENKLGLLQTEQALADYLKILLYLQTSNQSNYQCQECPVMVFGGSYSGELSVWLRCVLICFIFCIIAVLLLFDFQCFIAVIWYFRTVWFHVTVPKKQER